MLLYPVPTLGCTDLVHEPVQILGKIESCLVHRLSCCVLELSSSSSLFCSCFALVYSTRVNAFVKKETGSGQLVVLSFNGTEKKKLSFDSH